MIAPPIRLAIPPGRPLLAVTTVATVLDTNTRGVVELVEQGRIRFAWDIASPGSRSRCLRILARCVADLQAGTDSFPEGDRLAWEMVLHMILPQFRERMPLREVQRLLAVTESYMLAAARAGLLPAERRQVARGPHSTYFFPTRRMAEWLQDRLL